MRTIHFAPFPCSALKVSRCHRSGSARDRRRFAGRMFARDFAQEQCEEYRTWLRKKLNFDAVAADASGSSTWSSEIRVTLLELSNGDGRGRVGRYVGIYTPALASHEYRLSLERGYVIMSEGQGSLSRGGHFLRPSCLNHWAAREVLLCFHVINHNIF